MITNVPLVYSEGRLYVTIAVYLHRLILHRLVSGIYTYMVYYRCITAVVSSYICDEAIEHCH